MTLGTNKINEAGLWNLNFTRTAWAKRASMALEEKLSFSKTTFIKGRIGSNRRREIKV